jgi:NAD(P)-dependent dehydrogenase (short-subunit alcohol dehydrogenase family)
MNDEAPNSRRQVLRDLTTGLLLASGAPAAMFWLTTAAIPHMKHSSSIICTTSINAYSPEPYILDYAATKGAIAIYVKALAKQWLSKAFA